MAPPRLHNGGMAAISVIYDCDPGVDDAVALFLAFAARDAIDLLGITAVGGCGGGTHRAQRVSGA